MAKAVDTQSTLQPDHRDSWSPLSLLGTNIPSIQMDNKSLTQKLSQRNSMDEWNCQDRWIHIATAL